MTLIINRKWIFLISTFFFLGGLFCVLSIKDRTDFVAYFIPFTFSFAAYLWITLFQDQITRKHLFFITVFAFFLTIIFPPYLSNDYYRFLWDGELFWNSINPFDYTPNQLVKQNYIAKSDYLKQLYTGMSELSQSNYSCYPPLNQFYFIVSSALSNSVYFNMIVLKLSIVLTELIGLFYLLKVLELLNISSNKAFLLFLNPLFLIEGIGNCHFEGVMISYLIIAFYFLIRSNYIGVGLFIALAIQIKLTPLLILPFFFQTIGWKKSLYTFTQIGCIILFLSILFIDSSNAPHFFKSLGLYFKLFQFNSSLLFALIHLDPLHFYYHKISQYSFILSQFTVLLIFWLAFIKKITHKKDFFVKICIAYFLFLLLSSNVHPWYILPALFLSILSNYSFVVLWSFTAFISYSFYREESHFEAILITIIEYIPVLTLFTYEILRGGLFRTTKNAIQTAS